MGDLVSEFSVGLNGFPTKVMWGERVLRQRMYAHTSVGDLIEQIRCKFSLNNKDSFDLSFVMGTGKTLLIVDDIDMKMVWECVRLYRIELLCFRAEVYVHDNSPFVNMVCGDSVEADDVLGVSFRNGKKRTYLSDPWCSIIQGVGQVFKKGKTEFKSELAKYAAAKGFNYILRKNDNRYQVICDKGITKVAYQSERNREAGRRDKIRHSYVIGCSPKKVVRKLDLNTGVCEGVELCGWYIRAVQARYTGYLTITHMEGRHTCCQDGWKMKHPRIDANIVSECIRDDVAGNVSVRPKDIQKKFKELYGIEISHKVASNARDKARVNVYGDADESFERLVWYKKAVEESNPGTYFDIEVEPVSNRFKRSMIAYSGSINGFRHCIPVLYVDGTFGKSRYKGQILVAIGRDGNNGMFPLSTCYCDSENESNWIYFFAHLKTILRSQGRVITFVSDRGLGLLKAYDTVFPNNPHLYCYKHLTFNLKTAYMKRKCLKDDGTRVEFGDVLECFQKLAYSSTRVEYEVNLVSLREAAGTRRINDFLSNIPLQNWCRAFSPPNRYGIMASSMAESFNNWILDERMLPVYHFMDHTRVKCMELIYNRGKKGMIWDNLLCPKKQAELNSNLLGARDFYVYGSKSGLFEVRGTFNYVVDLNTCACSCMKWQINCFSCAHALCAIQKDCKHYSDFIDPCFFTSSYKACYNNPIFPVSNVDESFYNAAIKIQAPAVKNQPGRSSLNKRHPSQGESSGRKLFRYSNCKKLGSHNSRYCPHPKPDQLC